MKIVCISDTHGLYQPSDLPDGDMLIHAGDLSTRGEIHQIQHALAWLRKFPHKYKIFIGGNHDGALETCEDDFHPQMQSYKDSTPLIYLRDTEINIEGLRIFGTPATEFKDMYNPWARAFCKMPHSLNRFWEHAPKCDILIAHGPPKFVLDFDFGSDAQAVYVNANKPKLHIFGHIHAGHGMKIGKHTTFVNAAMLGEDYQTRNEPIVVEI